MSVVINGDTGISGVNGSAATPAIQGGDADTGIFFGTDTASIATGGTSRVHIDASGNFSLGNTTPRAKLDVPGTASGLAHIGGTGTTALTLGHNNTTGSIISVNAGTSYTDLNIDGKDIRMRVGTGSASERFKLESNGRLNLGNNNATNGQTMIQGWYSGEDKLNVIGSQHSTGGMAICYACRPKEGGAGYVSAASNAAFGKTALEVSNQLRFLSVTGATVDRDAAVTLTEKFRVTNSGDLNTTGNDTYNRATAGFTSRRGDSVTAVRNNGTPLEINRTGNDGSLINFFQAGSGEGNITVSGSSVSLTGAHLSRWTQLAGNAERVEILRGTVLSNLDEMCEWSHTAQEAYFYEEEDAIPEGFAVGDVKVPAVDAFTEDNEQLNRMKVSDVEGDRNVAGVFQAWDDDDDTYVNDFYCAMTGDFVIRIAQGTTVSRGDLLISAGDGTAKPQEDDVIRSKTIAKVTSTSVSTTYSDGSYCVPCVLMAC